MFIARGQILQILRDESMPSGRCYDEYREAYLCRMSDWYQWFLNLPNIETEEEDEDEDEDEDEEGPALYPDVCYDTSNTDSGFLKLKMYDGDTSTFMSLMETMCLPQLSQKLAFHESASGFQGYDEWRQTPPAFAPLEFVIMNYKVC
jgi:hypothetical protein